MVHAVAGHLLLAQDPRAANLQTRRRAMATERRNPTAAVYVWTAFLALAQQAANLRTRRRAIATERCTMMVHAVAGHLLLAQDPRAANLQTQRRAMATGRHNPTAPVYAGRQNEGGARRVRNLLAVQRAMVKVLCKIMDHACATTQQLAQDSPVPSTRMMPPAPDRASRNLMGRASVITMHVALATLIAVQPFLTKYRVQMPEWLILFLCPQHQQQRPPRQHFPQF